MYGGDYKHQKNNGNNVVRRKMLTYHKDNVILNPGNVDLDFPEKRFSK